MRDVSFALGRGQLLALIGPNGAGKSTCFNLLNGQLRPDAGSVRLAGEDITGLPPRQIWRRGVGRTFQITATFGSMTVRENVQMVLLSRHRRLFELWPRGRGAVPRRGGGVACSRRHGEQAERASGLLAYGDVKRVELAMALAHEPGCCLMDEPTAGMAPKERTALMALIAELARERESACCSPSTAWTWFHVRAEVLVLSRGEIIAQGDPESVRENPEVQAVYLGTGRLFGARRAVIPVEHRIHRR